MSFIHALFSENIDDDFRTMVEGHSYLAMVCKENGAMTWVNSTSADSPQERRDDAHKDILLFELSASGLFAYVVT
jgi:hypothetical protein